MHASIDWKSFKKKSERTALVKSEHKMFRYLNTQKWKEYIPALNREENINMSETVRIHDDC